MLKETSETTKPKTPRRRLPAVVSAIETASETSPARKPRRRVTKPKATTKNEVTTLSSEALETPVRKAPTVLPNNEPAPRSGIKVSRHWYVMAAILLLTFVGAAYIGSQGSGKIDVDTLMTERRRALNEERSTRTVPVQNQAAAVTALEGASGEINKLETAGEIIPPEVGAPTPEAEVEPVVVVEEEVVVVPEESTPPPLP